jgi:hypothetical protein
MKKRLITFGCSFTYGQGLPDCLTGDEAPSQYSWPYLLSKKLNRSLVNCGVPGASNLQILNEILNFNFEKNDLVIVMWSLVDRDTIFFKRVFSKGNLLIKVGAWTKNIIAKRYLKQLDLHDQKLKSWFYIHHADLYFKNKKVEYIHYPAVVGELLACKPTFIDIDKMYHEGVSWIDTTTDNHPGIESNKETAERIFKIINV